MEQQTTFGANSSKKVPPNFEVDENGGIKIDFEQAEIDLENLSFKPITKGLGFHQKNSTAKPVAILKNKTPIKEKVNTPVDLSRVPRRTRSTQTEEISFSALPQTVAEEKKTPVEEKIAAPIPLQLLAWLLDFSVVGLLVAVTILAFCVTSGVNIRILQRLLSSMELAILISCLFSIYYFVYFTVLDLSVTPGKSLLGLRLIRTDGKRVKIKQTFSRATVVLLSFALLGLPLIMDFQGKLSDTKVVR